MVTPVRGSEVDLHYAVRGFFLLPEGPTSIEQALVASREMRKSNVPILFSPGEHFGLAGFMRG